jgi:hypothetical protein
VRVTDAEAAELDAVARLHGLSKSAVIKWLVHREYRQMVQPEARAS